MAIIAAFALAPTAKAKAAVIRSGAASYCDPTSSRVFSRFGDSAYYARMMNGGFENGSTAWVPASACSDHSKPAGILTILDGGTINGSGTWAPSPRMALLLSNVLSLVGTRAVAFKFTPVGAGASYQINDVYLDPWEVHIAVPAIPSDRPVISDGRTSEARTS